MEKEKDLVRPENLSDYLYSTIINFTSDEKKVAHWIISSLVENCNCAEDAEQASAIIMRYVHAMATALNKLNASENKH